MIAVPANCDEISQAKTGRIIFEGEMLFRTTQIFCIFTLNSKTIVKSILDTDDNCKMNSLALISEIRVHDCIRNTMPIRLISRKLSVSLRHYRYQC